MVFALQHYGNSDIDGLLALMRNWAAGTNSERRTAAAALCEPVMLASDKVCSEVIGILDSITRGIESETSRKEDGFIVLKKGMSYCWSVAAAAYPGHGLPFIEKWCGSGDPDIRRIMKENLKKNRLRKIDSAWCDAMLDRLG